MRIHFIAIGGSAMHNLAIALKEKTYHVSGSDDYIYEPSKSRLASKGLLPKQMGWYPERITTDIDFVVLGMHAREDNLELQRAKDLGIKVYSYPEYLYEHSKDKTRIVIAGSHGKTTTTAMILHVLHYHKREVDYMVGAQLAGFDTMVHLTDTNEFMVLEGDEYLTSAIDRRPKIHWYFPNIALITGIAWDHVNVFPTFKNYIEQFDIFIKLIIEGGTLVYNEEDDVLKDLISNDESRIRKQAYTTPVYKIIKGKTHLQTPMGDLPLAIFGQHNLSNLSGAKWICQHIGIDEDDFYEAIGSFSGASMRSEKLLEREGNAIYRDYAHSPSKVMAATQAFKQQFPKQHLLACLELHTFSSLNIDFLNEYKHSMDSADTAVVFYDEQTLQRKGKTNLSIQDIRLAFEREDIKVFTQTIELIDFIKSHRQITGNILLMSSGSFGGLDIQKL